MSKRKANILLGALALALGGSCYLLFRSNSYVAVWVDSFLPLEWLRYRLRLLSCNLLRYYIPDLLWAFSLGCGLLAIYEPGRKGTILCGATAFLCGCVWELLQYAEVVIGTADGIDVLMYFLASLLCVCLNMKRRGEK